LQGRPGLTNKNLTTEKIESAFSKLSVIDQTRINRMAATLEQNIKARWLLKPKKDKMVFGRLEALEVLAKMGIWMVEEGE
jgi:hypothetical protein